MRVEKVITIIKDREPSEKYPNCGWSFDFKDENGQNYEWNTMTSPDNNIHSGQKWLVRMTLKTNHEVLNYKYTRVERVKFIKRLQR